MLYAAASAAEPSRGWGGPLAILAAFVIFRVVVMPVGQWVMGKIKNPSPTPALPTAERVKVKATVGFTDPEPDEPEVGWWGRIVEVGGVRYRQARQIATTGSHVLPEPDMEPEPPEDDIDLALDGEPEEGEEDGEPAEKYIGRARDLKVPYNQIKRVVIDNYNVSESTAKRLIKRVDEQRAA